MIYFGTSAYDPLEGSTTSIDPLNSLSTSVQLAELIFPGSSGRIWKIRYLSILCFLIKASQPKDSRTQKENYLRYRPFENAMIIAATVASKNNGTDPGLKGLMGNSKAKRLIENAQRSKVDLTGEILSNQSNLGPLGVHLVFLRELGLVVEDNIILTESGDFLASLYQRNLKSCADLLIETGSRPRASLEALEKINPGRFSFKLGPSQKDEARFLRELLLENDDRAQLLSDLKGMSVRNDGDLEAFFIQEMRSQKSSSHSNHYSLIYHFDEFQKYFHYFFYHFVEGDSAPKKLSELKKLSLLFPEIEKQLIQHGDAFRSFITPHSSKRLSHFQKILDGVLARVSNFDEFTTYLISEHHQRHQKAKSKSPWVTKKEDTIYPVFQNIQSSESVEKILRDRLHRYRFANAFSILSDLEEAA